MHPDKRTVILEAGALNHDVIGALWDQGFVTSKNLPKQHILLLYVSLTNLLLQLQALAAVLVWSAQPSAAGMVFCKGSMA